MASRGFCCLLLFASTLLWAGEEADSLSCKDEHGNNVDWFAIYKLPQKMRNTSTSRNVERSGLSYFYTSSLSNTRWALSNQSIADPSSAVGITLQPLWEQGNESLLYVIYNDQPPDRPAVFIRGHTKGIMMFAMDPQTGEGSGFWLVHSVPHFLNRTHGGYSYPSSGHVNGQVFFCVNFPASAANQIGEQMMYTSPNIFDWNVPDNLAKYVPSVVMATKNKTVKASPWYRQINITSSSGTTYMQFAKHRKFRKDIYADWIAPTIQTGLYVQTWPIGRDRLPSVCNDLFPVMNIEYIDIGQDLRFLNHMDHSKWAVSENTTKPWICIGDLNRMDTQKRRGGGALCVENKLLSAAFLSAAAMLEACRY